MHIKTLEAIMARKDALVSKQAVIKKRLKQAAMMKHIESCAHCKAAFAAHMEQRDYEKAGEMTQELIANILTTNLGQNNIH